MESPARTFARRAQSSGDLFPVGEARLERMTTASFVEAVSRTAQARSD